MIDHQQLNSLLSSLRKRIKAADFALAAAMSVESIDAWFGGVPGITWGGNAFILDAFTLTKRGSSFSSPNAHPNWIQNLNPDRQESLRLVKKIFCAQPRTQPQIAVTVSEVVNVRGTQNTVFLGFLEKLFFLCLFFKGCVDAKM